MIIQTLFEVVNLNLKLTVKSTLISLVIFCVCLLICGLLVYYNLVTQSLSNIILFVAFAVSSLVGAFISAKVCEEKILLNALLVGIFLSLAVFVTAIVINNSPAIHPRTLILMGCILLASFMGAILGNK